jgi:hypothetical protein
VPKAPLVEIIPRQRLRSGQLKNLDLPFLDQPEVKDLPLDATQACKLYTDAGGATVARIECSAWP